MRLVTAAAVSAILCLTAANALADTICFQDDFSLTYGVSNQPGAPNGQIAADGRLVDVNGNTIGWFHLTGVTPIGATTPTPAGPQYSTTYLSSLKITDITDTTVVWASTAGSITTIVDADRSDFPAQYYVPSGHSPYQSIGDGSFKGSGVTLPGSAVAWGGVDSGVLPRLGSYNWSYYPNRTGSIGHIEGEIPVPEPGILLLLGTGLCALGLGLSWTRK
jgi:hypothetical protein